MSNITADDRETLGELRLAAIEIAGAIDSGATLGDLLPALVELQAGLNVLLRPRGPKAFSEMSGEVRSGLFPRKPGQCHGYARYTVACRNKALMGELLCQVHAPEQSPAIMALQREAARAARKARDEESLLPESSLASIACGECGHLWTADARKVAPGPLKCPACGEIEKLRRRGA